MIEIPNEYREAWKQAEHGRDFVRVAELADALVWSLARLERSEFLWHENHRSIEHGIASWCVAFEGSGCPDPRHTFKDDARWEQFVRDRLEGR